MRAPIVTIHRPSYYSRRVTEATAFIPFINGQEPNMNKLWCLGLGRIRHTVHPKAYVEVTIATVREFVND